MNSWEVVYHAEVMNDLSCVGHSAARRIMKAIDSKLTIAPLKFGAPLSGNLSVFRKLRIGDYRVVYQVGNYSAYMWNPDKPRSVTVQQCSRCAQAG